MAFTGQLVNELRWTGNDFMSDRHTLLWGFYNTMFPLEISFRYQC